MILYSCPYCGSNTFAGRSKKNGSFTSFEDVSRHVRICNQKTKGLARLYSITLIRNFYNIFNRIPTRRDFDKTLLKNTYTPSYNTIVLQFGSWNNAILESGFSVNDALFGVKTKALDGIIYRSQLEAYFVDHFLFEKEEYEYEKPYGNGWLFDFYLSKKDLYIEIDGGFDDSLSNYRSKMVAKKSYCLVNNLILKIFTNEEVYRHQVNI